MSNGCNWIYVCYFTVECEYVPTLHSRILLVERFRGISPVILQNFNYISAIPERLFENVLSFYLLWLKVPYVPMSCVIEGCKSHAGRKEK